MNWILLLAILSGIAVAQGIFLGINALRKEPKKISSYFYLGIFLIALSLRIGKSLFYYYWPEMSVFGVTLGAIGLMAIGPSLYYYIRKTKDSSDKRAWVHYLPSIALFLLIFWLDMSVMYYIYFAGAISLTLYLLASVVHLRKSDGIRLLILFSLTAVINLMLYYQLLSNSMMSYAIGAFVAAGMLYMLNFWGLSKLGLILKKQERRPLPKETQLVINEELIQLMNEGIYRESSLTLNLLAQKMNRPPYLVRSTIHQQHEQKFNDFINHFRIMEVEKNLREKDQLYTIEAIAKNAGFSSLTSFYNAFKKIKGCTPLEYKKQVEEDSNLSVI